MRIGYGVVIAAIGIALLAGCTPEAPENDGGTGQPAADPTPTGTAETTTPDAPVFAMPELCADILTASTQSAFDAAGRDLLGGPDGRYGEDYFEDPTPEERAGGITCVWGDEDETATTVIVSVAPITASNRSGIVKALIDNGLVESQVEGGLTYARIGDDVSAPAELHVIRTESWISVVEAVGGEERFQQATELVDEVTAQVYAER
ncbi:hypothetical protein [Pseudolysinimonas sp.]|jgi:hypothetical protein|uniref:hypothetical protein n=1 Tax=Pseudolysinimonas sp. TaxID=2680009 RepID=UPI003784EEBA